MLWVCSCAPCIFAGYGKGTGDAPVERKWINIKCIRVVGVELLDAAAGRPPVAGAFIYGRTQRNDYWLNNLPGGPETGWEINYNERVLIRSSRGGNLRVSRACGWQNGGGKCAPPDGWERDARESCLFLWMQSDQSEVMMVPAGDSGRKRPFNIVYIIFFSIFISQYRIWCRTYCEEKGFKGAKA